MYAFALLFHRELHLCELILERVSRTEREATPTPASCMDFGAFQYPLRTDMCDDALIEHIAIFCFIVKCLLSIRKIGIS